jgi:phage baseplate assembly protein W
MKSISYPFTIDPFGVVFTTNSQSKIYQDRILTLLSTAKGERPMRPTYGTDIGRAMFENQGSVNPAIKSAILSAMGTWIPEVTVDNILISGIEDNGQVQVTLQVTLPDYSSVSLNVLSSTLNPDSTVTR